MTPSSHRSAADPLRAGAAGGVFLLALLTLPCCTYYAVTRPDGSTERISRAEYEDLQRTSRRLGDVPSTRIQPGLESQPRPAKK